MLFQTDRPALSSPATRPTPGRTGHKTGHPSRAWRPHWTRSSLPKRSAESRLATSPTGTPPGRSLPRRGDRRVQDSLERVMGRSAPAQGPEGRIPLPLLECDGTLAPDPPWPRPTGCYATLESSVCTVKWAKGQNRGEGRLVEQLCARAGSCRVGRYVHRAGPTKHSRGGN